MNADTSLATGMADPPIELPMGSSVATPRPGSKCRLDDLKAGLYCEPHKAPV